MPDASCSRWIDNGAKKQIQRPDPLDQALFQALPLPGRNDTGDRVKGEQPLVEFAVFIDAEFHTVPPGFFVRSSPLFFRAGIFLAKSLALARNF